MILKVKNLLRENSGQGLIEYSLILLFIAVAVTVVLQLLGSSVLGLYQSVTGEWPGLP
ncbi:MAG: Flp family type IVb pilin [Firmicutes bacterium]|nr:Flp family type IVb pilin [Bacillota bacterium]